MNRAELTAFEEGTILRTGMQECAFTHHNVGITATFNKSNDKNGPPLLEKTWKSYTVIAMKQKMKLSSKEQIIKYLAY